MSILGALSQVANIFAEKAAAKAKAVKAPSGIEFSVGSPQQSKVVSSVSVSATHPAVAAYEYGSGIHRTKGEKVKYEIVPRNKTYLAFLWPKVDNEPGFKRLPDGRVLLSHVNHPGVEQRAFLRPTFEENKEQFRKIIGTGFKTEILANSYIGNEKVKIEVIKMA